jgi:hypothetical protein
MSRIEETIATEQRPMWAQDEHNSSQNLSSSATGSPAIAKFAHAAQRISNPDTIRTGRSVRKRASAPGNFKTKDLLGILDKSPSGKTLVDLSQSRGIKIITDNSNPDVMGYFDPGDAVATLAHELRHAVQEGFQLHEGLEHSPKDNVLIARVMEADAESYADKVSWELKESGYDKAWAAQKEGSYSNMADAFEDAITKDPNSLSNGKAHRSAYDAWFESSENRNNYDTDTLENIDMDRKDGMFYKGMARRPVRPDDVAEVGQLPDGTNYLEQTGKKGLTGAKYAGHMNKKNQKMMDKLNRAIDKANGTSKTSTTKTGRKREMAAEDMGMGRTSRLAALALRNKATQGHSR